eukprot:4493076-Pleurochrysis_carterae.AAC.3
MHALYCGHTAPPRHGGAALARIHTVVAAPAKRHAKALSPPACVSRVRCCTYTPYQPRGDLKPAFNLESVPGDSVWLLRATNQLKVAHGLGG